MASKLEEVEEKSKKSSDSLDHCAVTMTISRKPVTCDITLAPWSCTLPSCSLLLAQLLFYSFPFPLSLKRDNFVIRLSALSLFFWFSHPNRPVSLKGLIHIGIHTHMYSHTLVFEFFHNWPEQKKSSSTVHACDREPFPLKIKFHCL